MRMYIYMIVYIYIHTHIRPCHVYTYRYIRPYIYRAACGAQIVELTSASNVMAVRLKFYILLLYFILYFTTLIYRAACGP